jgi:hypothetical protein
MSGGYFYLGSPYSHAAAAIRHSRYESAADCTAWLLKGGVWVYSPIVHCHEIAVKHGLPTDAAFWSAYNHALVRTSVGLLVLAIDGWKESRGLAMEIAWADELKLPIRALNPKGDGDYEQSIMGVVHGEGHDYTR